MLNIAVMQSKIDKLLSIFKKLIAELEKSIGELNGAIDTNKEIIAQKETDNIMYAEKIEEYERLKQNIENIIKQAIWEQKGVE